jgi:xylulokinase
MELFMAERAFLGIDIGTYGSKGVLLSAQGQLLAVAQREHGMETPRPGWAEQDADAVWWADFCSIARELSAAAEQAGVKIAAVAASAIGPTCLPVDTAGRPLRPSILYGIDTRAAAQI